MSLECSYCEHDLRGPHADNCPLVIANGNYAAADEIEKLRGDLGIARAALKGCQKALSDHNKMLMKAAYEAGAHPQAQPEMFEVWFESRAKERVE